MQFRDSESLGDFWRQIMHLKCKRVHSLTNTDLIPTDTEYPLDKAIMTDEVRANGAVVIDKVRASKAGHAYHEAWAARTALELLLPVTNLTAITLEGFDELDEQELGIGAVEIADLVRYHGGTDVAQSQRVDIVQFKYSIASAEKAVRAADLASTLVKFAITDAELRAAHGDDHVENVVRYEFATNRPIHENLAPAINALIAGADVDGDVRRQAGQLTRALNEYPHETSGLLRRLELVGSKGSLVDAERHVSATLAAWSEPGDPDAEKRLLKLRNLIRIKAGPGSEADKRIDRVAVLAELEVDHENRLYPTPDAFPEVRDVVQRDVLSEIVARAREAGGPLIVHGAGGMGKTVLMQGIADKMRSDGPVVLFDGFGAGRWRDPADGRHLPDRTLVHLANLLAGEGLCDVLLPVADVTSLLKAFRRRLAQSVATARNTHPYAHLSLVLDAIDHAGLAADETATSSFAHLLLRSISVEPIDGVRLIASCRTERLMIAIGDNVLRKFLVPLFSDAEARTLITRRVPDASADEIAALLTRSGRNPRCLDSLLSTGRPFDPLQFPDAPDEPQDILDALLRKRLEDTRNTARARGAKDADIDLLLAGIALLAPPVPIEELAAAHGLMGEEVESFAADLAPLLERTPHGLMFRDEPTETLIRSTYGTDQASRDRIISALQGRQLTSSYAARALPALLTSLRDADQLIHLAYDLRVPAGASLVSTRDIRLARITAAIALSGELGRHDDLLKLLLEASLVAAGHERSDRFLYEHPDLAAVSADPEALRRLAFTNVGWPGGKHSALALANAFAGDRDEARRHARRAIDWYNWAAQTRRSTWSNTANVSRSWDDVGFAYVEMLAGNDLRVARFIDRKGEAQAFVKFSELFDLLERHQTTAQAPSAHVILRLPRCRLASRALFAAALQFNEHDHTQDKRVLNAMAAAPPLTDQSASLAMASVLASARAADLGMIAEGIALIEGAGLKAKTIYDYSSCHPIDRTVHVSLAAAGVKAALRGKPPTLIDIAPSELINLVAKSARNRGPAVFSRALSQKLTEPKYDGGRPRRKRRSSVDDKVRVEYSRALSGRINPLLRYAQDIASIVRPPAGQTRAEMLNAAFDRVVSDVEQASSYPYRDGE
ncbi:NACHT domain-containing protein [Paracoccus everestensis]|uniref:NACHT domain-containing protein n=1 Tax=Paracoccus everestensis TaxID=2903900 RepID=UPI001F23C9D8|nr:NACHT domain-containing protein [Paracoccus everestensis]